MFRRLEGIKPAVVLLAIASGAIGVVAFLGAMAFAVTGRRGRPVLGLTAATLLPAGLAE